MTKRGGKREGAGRPSQNSVSTSISLPKEQLDFVKKNKLSLSKLAQQKIKEVMKDKIMKMIETSPYNTATLKDKSILGKFAESLVLNGDLTYHNLQPFDKMTVYTV